MRILKTLNVIAATTAVTMLAICNGASVATAGANVVFSYPSGFSGLNGAFQNVSAAAFQGSAFNLTAGGSTHQAGAIWYKTQQNITSFSTQFTFQMAKSSTIPTINGMTFCIQNSNPTTNPTDQYGIHSGIYAGTDANISGYGAYVPYGQIGIQKSIAVKFDVGSNSGNEVTYPAGGSPSATGLYINGGPSGGLIPENDLNPSGINLNSGHVMAANIVYDGKILTMTLRDTVTNAQFRTSWPIDIPSVVGSNTAWVGFTDGEIPVAANNVLSWSFATGYATRLATPTFSASPGAYTSGQSVTINGPSGATIYYTTNGQKPTTASNKYSGPVSVGSSEIVQAIAVQSGYTDSLVGTGNYQVGAAGTPLINFAGGFGNASNFVNAVGSAKVNGSSMRLTDSNSSGQEVGAAWYAVPVNVSTFTTHFTLLFTSASGQGMTFCIQNQNPTSTDANSIYVSGGPYAFGNNFGGLGYSGTTTTSGGQNAGLYTSVALVFDLSSGSGSVTGLYTNGANPAGSSIDMSSSGVNLHSGHPLNVTLDYNGSALAMTVKDSVTNATFTHSWSVDIPSTVAGSTAYVGFTGSTGYSVANQDIQSWTYATSATAVAAVPAAPTNLRVQ
jgi:hypothetical protein